MAEPYLMTHPDGLFCATACVEPVFLLPGSAKEKQPSHFSTQPNTSAVVGYIQVTSLLSGHFNEGYGSLVHRAAVH